MPLQTQCTLCVRSRSGASLMLNCWAICPCVAVDQELGSSEVQLAGGVVTYQEGHTNRAHVTLHRIIALLTHLFVCVFRDRFKCTFGFNQVRCERSTALLFCCRYTFTEYPLCGLYPELEIIKSYKGDRNEYASYPTGRENINSTTCTFLSRMSKIEM